MKSLAYAIFIFFIIYISGCGKNDENDYEDSKMYDVKTAPNDNGTKSSDTVSTNKVNSAKTLPPDFPSDIPVYMNAKILASSSGNNPMVTLETDDDIKDVSDYYIAEMKKNGYSSDNFSSKLQNSNDRFLIFSKEGKQYTISCLYNEAKAKTLITIQTRSSNNQTKDTSK